MNIENIKVGDTLWVLDRARVRNGSGPFQVLVAEIRDGAFRASGTRGWYSPRDFHATESEARLAWSQRAEVELQRETARYNLIASRLTAWQRHGDAS